MSFCFYGPHVLVLNRTEILDPSLGCRGPNELRCVRRDWLLRALEEELPKGTIRYSSKIVAIEEDGNAKIIHLADGAILRAKVGKKNRVIP
jgi:2-polyprenyl-6-methoxyphenol hydroxylase-like FAD-dependent oxidoreductase